MGKLIKKLAELIGFDRTFNLLMAKLEQEIVIAKENQNSNVPWVNIHGVLVALE